MIDKTYQPSEVEGRIYRTWEQAGAFRAGRPERAGAKPYSIVIPPPNVTGSLHMGHALNNTLQDILCRFERMRGRDVLWQPGTDHAGIATQMVVERQLMERQQPSRREMGREAFLKRVWEWKAESGGTIVNQLKRLGASCDWSRERFTMGKRGEPDDQMVRAVMKAFVDLYNTKLPDGTRLIYKDKRLVNWDPKLLTAISDLEVVQVETKGHLWHLRYPIESKTFNAEDPSTFIVVATTRPETMLGDSAVAVHPDDVRYKALVGKNVILPLVGRKIPIIADEYSDPEKGSGAVKITPAHDFNDFEVGKRHKLAQINILSIEAKLALKDNVDFLAGVPASSELDETMAMHGMDRFAARKQIVARLEMMGIVEKIEPHGNVVPHGDRSNVVIEPFLTDQWYVNAKKLAEPAIASVREGKTKFVPQNWEKTYFEWMENIQPWCISRQLWWGHQIPAWYGPEFKDEKITYDFSDGRRNKIFVAESEQEAINAAREFYKKTVVVVESSISPLKKALEGLGQDDISIWRDPDVLDTWFSSALWPFSTLGWPEATPEVKRYYPTNALVTGFDIIFFWVARMMMMGLHFQKEVPFHDVYIHRLVRDATGAKMSKSKGNVVDPLGVIDDFGADALRFTLARGAAQGHDIRLGPQDVENNRNFATKLWNAARFVEFNGAKRVEGFDPKSAKETLNRWIAHETAKAAREVTEAIVAYRFNEAAGAAYRFVWNIYCDWYVELTKPILFVGNWIDNAIRESASAPEYQNYTLQQILDVILSPNFLGSEAKRLQADGMQGAHLLADAANSIQTASDQQAYLRRIVETRATAAWVLDEILKLLHPFMPFITEELWAVTAESSALTGQVSRSLKQKSVGLSEFTAAIANDHQIPKSKAEAVIEDMVELIAAYLKKGARVRVTGFGSFGVRNRAARAGRNPATGKPMQIKASKTVAFRAAKKLKDEISGLSDLRGTRASLLALSDWPKLDGLTDDKAEAEIGWVIELITAIRAIRAEMNINVNIPLVLAGASKETQGRVERWAEFIKRLARVSEISSAAVAPQGSVQLVVRGEVAALPLIGVIDLDAERARLAKEMQKAEADIARVDAKLNNANFVARAPEEVVEEEKEKRAEAVARKEKIAEALERLKGAV